MQFGFYRDFESIPEQRSRSSVLQRTTLGRSRLNQDQGPNNHVNTLLANQPFGLLSRISSSGKNLKYGQNVDEIQRNPISTVSRTFGLISEDLDSDVQSSERLHHELRRSDCSIKGSLMSRPFGFQSRSLTSLSHLSEDNSGVRQNKDSMLRNLSTSKGFRPIPGSSSLALHMQDSESFNGSVIDVFKQPLMPRVIRGRNSTLSSRLFHSENTDRHCKDLSNINGFNVSQVPQRNIDTLCRSRFGLSERRNCIDNQSISQSIISRASGKAQLMNLLENLHYSILSIGPQITAEALRLEFDKAKQSLENISEMSFEPSILKGDAASVISHSSRNIAPAVNQTATSSTLDGDLLRLKSSREILQSLISVEGRATRIARSNSSVQRGGKTVVISSSRSKESHEEENSSFVFKKPNAPKKRKSPVASRVETPRRGKSSTPKVASKVINLKNWYPIAVGSELAFCGVDEKGAAVKTDAVKRRLSNRKVELTSGLACHLVGSPSSLVSVLPKKIASSMKDGLAERWRVLQRELLNCQALEKQDKRKSKNPLKVTSSPKKKAVKHARWNVDGGKVQNTKITSAPVGVAEMRTRSGRSIKPPRAFWLVADTGNDEVISSSSRATPVAVVESSRRKSRKSIEESRVKRTSKSGSESPGFRRRVASREKRKKEVDKTPREKSKSSKAKRSKKEEEEQAKAESFTNRQNKSPQSRGKRKGEVAGDAEAVKSKKSKIEKKVKVVVSDSTQGKAAMRVTESKKGMKERREAAECEGDFELKLDDIEIPEIGNMSRNTQFNRSQMRLVSMETPPLRYFTNSLKVLANATPVRSPDWCISQRTETGERPSYSFMVGQPRRILFQHVQLGNSDGFSPSGSWGKFSLETGPHPVVATEEETELIENIFRSEVKQFQRRREEAFKKKIKVDIKKTVITEKSGKGVQNRDVKRVMEWVAEKSVKSPQWNSKVLHYIIPSRKRMEQQANEEDEEDEEDIETEFL